MKVFLFLSEVGIRETSLDEPAVILNNDTKWHASHEKKEN
jgi:hypothetical protein